MVSVGEKLRKARIEQGRDLEKIAGDIRVNRSYLEAIEKGDAAALPGAFFARSFVRQYAGELGISYSEIEEDLERWLSEGPGAEPPRLKPNTPVEGLAPVTHVLEGGRRPRSKLMGALLALVLVVGACAALYAYWLKGRSAEPVPSVLPDRAEPPPRVTPPAAAVEEPPAAEPAPEGPLWFEIAAVEEVWVRVKTGDRTLYMGILQPGDSRRFTGLEFASLRVGNAGGLTLRVNGRPVPRIGPRGHIRVIHLTPEKTDIVASPRAPAAFGQDN